MTFPIYEPHSSNLWSLSYDEIEILSETDRKIYDLIGLVPFDRPIMRRDPACYVLLDGTGPEVEILSIVKDTEPVNEPEKTIQIFKVSRETGIRKFKELKLDNQDEPIPNPEKTREGKLDLEMDCKQYERVKVMGLLTEAFKPNHLRLVAQLNDIQKEKMDEIAFLDSLHEENYSIYYKIKELKHRIKINKIEFFSLRQESLQALEFGESAQDIIARFSVLKIFLL